jgi:hypothetical protein
LCFRIDLDQQHCHRVILPQGIEHYTTAPSRSKIGEKRTLDTCLALQMQVQWITLGLAQATFLRESH